MRSVWISLLIFGLNADGRAGEERPADTIRILIQSSPLAGSQYYHLTELQPSIRVGDPLELIREPNNAHDKDAVSVWWRGNALGYLPRKENRAIAAAIDKGEAVRAQVENITADTDPWKRLRIAVFVEL